MLLFSDIMVQKKSSSVSKKMWLKYQETINSHGISALKVCKLVVNNVGNNDGNCAESATQQAAYVKTQCFMYESEN